MPYVSDEAGLVQIRNNFWHFVLILCLNVIQFGEQEMAVQLILRQRFLEVVWWCRAARPGDAAQLRLLLLIVRSSFSANGVSKQLFGNSCRRRRLYAAAARTLSEFPNCRPATRPADSCRKKLLHKSFQFSSVCLGMRAMRPPSPLMFLGECSKTTVLSEAPVPSVSGNVCGNHTSRYECFC